MVIPAYNAAAFIETTLQSVYNQSCADLEIIAVNDGSTDNTLAILQAQTDARLRIIDQKNGGECAARNRGVQEARGKYLAFLDSDDAWRSDHLELAARFFERRPDIVWYSTRYEKVQAIEETSLQPTADAPEFMLIEWFLEGDDWTSSSSAVLLREALPRLDLFPPGVRMFGDGVGWSRFAMKHPRMGVCTKRTALYRQGCASACSAYWKLTRSVSSLTSTGVSRVLEEMSALMKEPGCTPEARYFFQSYFIPRWHVHLSPNMYGGLQEDFSKMGSTLPPLPRHFIHAYISFQIFCSRCFDRILGKISRLRGARMKKRAIKRRIAC